MKLKHTIQIECKDIEEKKKVLLVLLTRHTWNSRSKSVIPPRMSERSFYTNLILVINKNSQRITQDSTNNNIINISANDVINETKEYLNLYE